VLLDASIDAETLQAVREVITADPGVTEVRWVTGRNAGRFRFVEAGVALRAGAIVKAETAVERIETSVRTVLPHIERVLLQVEAPTSPHVRYAAPLADVGGTLSDHLGEAPYVALAKVRRADGELAEQRIVANPHLNEEKAKGIRVAEWLVTQKTDVVLLTRATRGKGPEYVFRDAGITVRYTEQPTLEQALQLEWASLPTSGSDARQGVP
jgi:predicted Fe-Mo cluster-binding NifX family protein